MKTKFLIVLMFFFCLLTNRVFSEKEEAQQNRPAKYMILVLDTSSSMVRPAGNIFAEVKIALKRLITTLQKGDVIQLFTFDKNINIFPPIQIKSPDSKEVVIKMIDGFEARGEATFTSLMLKKLYLESKKIKNGYPEHYVTAVVLSDGYDWPPRGHKRISIKDYVTEGEENPMKEWFVYYIAFGVLDQKIAGTLKKLSPKTKIKKVTDGSEISKDIAEVDQEMNRRILAEEMAKPKLWQHPILIILFLLIVFFALGFFLWRKNKLILTGSVVYWKNTIKDAPVEVVDLTALKTGQFKIGREKNFDLYLADFPTKIPVIIRAKFSNTLVVPVLEWKARNRRIFKIHTQAREGRLSDGDIFSIGSYSFKYNNSG